MEKQIRREESNLIVIGTGLIAFGAWLVIKLFILFYLRRDSFMQPIAELTALEQALVQIVIIVFFFLLTALPLSIRLYVALSAIAEGRGKRKRHIYVGFAVFLALVELLSIGSDVYSFSLLSNNYANSIISIIIDLSSVYVLIVLIISATRLRRLRALADGKGA